MKKILIFTMSAIQSQFEADRVEEEAKKRGIKVDRRYYRDLRFVMEEGISKVFVGNDEITGEKYMGIWFRVAGTISGKYVEGRNMLIRLKEKEMRCINGEGYLKWPRMGKISQHGVFVENDIPVIPTKIFYTKEQVLDEEFNYPLIAKHERGYQGRSVKKFENREELERFVNKINEKNIGMFLWQKYLPLKWDLRVIVIGGRAIGGMKRMASGGEFRSNFSLGGEVEEWKLSEEERNLAEKVARVCGLDYGGVDIMKDEKERNYVLEVNRACQFRGFEKATDINVAKKVIELLYF